MLDVQGNQLATIAEHVTFYSDDIAEFSVKSYERYMFADITMLERVENSCYPMSLMQYLLSSRAIAL